MDKRWCYLLFLIWFFIILTSQVLLFSNGFLLSRVAQFRNSTCAKLDDFDCNQTLDSQCSKGENFSLQREHLRNAFHTCLKPRAKVILLIIDAFRYDFALYNDTIQEPDFYQNKLPIISEMRRKYPQNTRLYKFIADPPTTTMQRLKGLTTGSLPTFIDAGSNFATKEINEDNIIEQMVYNGYNTVFMGDDTWNGLYPNKFLRNYPFPSFNVWDLDTVDTGVKAHLFDEMKKTDWHLLIGHFLGVDHCGHRYGPNHPEMARKLSEVNDVLRKTISALDDNTVLFVIGDHGMTTSGDHGGETENEITAALFEFSKLKLSSSFFYRNDTIKQVDLVPTLSTILGVPIPFSNLGSLVHDALPIKLDSNWKYALYASWSNVQQLVSYIREYSSTTNSFDEDQLIEYEKTYNRFIPLVGNATSEVEFRGLAIELHNFIVEIRQMCEKIWIQFDAFSMARGLLLHSHTLIFVFLLIEGMETLENIITNNMIFWCFTSILASALTSLALYFANITTEILNITYFLAGLTAIIILATLCVQNFKEISLNFHELNKKRRWYDILSRVLLSLSCLMLFSNSFILEEAKIMLFFVVTLVLVILVDYSRIKFGKKKDFLLKAITRSKAFIVTLFICILLRVSVYFWRCREEQPCNDVLFSKSGFGRFEWVFTAVSLSLFVSASRIWLRTCGNLNGYSLTVTLAKYAPTVIIVCCSGFWVLHKLPKEMKVNLLGPWKPDMLAWVIYFLTGLGLSSLVIDPLCVYQLFTASTLNIDATGANVIPQLAKHVFISGKTKSDPPVVYGLATVYSSVFILLSLYFTLLWNLLLGDIIVLSCVILVFAVALILGLVSLLKYETSTKIEDLLSVSPSSILLWFFMSIYMFYGTGHQPSFPNIAWEAAFVGTDDLIKYNIIPATLVITNTFGSFILMGLALPLLQIVPFTLHIMFPTISKLKMDLSRGEMLLYDYDKNAIRNLFILCCKYSMCHALRVFCIMLASTIHCRHLMVWNIFAPKFIFEAIGFFVTLVSVTLSYLLFVHVNKRVDRFIKYLNKQFS